VNLPKKQVILFFWARFSTTTLSGRYDSNPSKRGPFGEVEIWVKSGTTPVSRPAFRFGGEKLGTHTALIRECIEKGNMEPTLSWWNLPSFPVQKAKGKYRLMQDFRLLSLVTDSDGHPFPRIIDILHSQGHFKICSKLDLVEGLHQMPLKAKCLSQSRTGQGLFWIKPPFSLLEKVVKIIFSEHVECFLLPPNWTATIWWEKVQAMCAKAHLFQPRTRLFETERGPSGPITWWVWVLYISKGIQTASVRITKTLGRDRQLKAKNWLGSGR